MFLLLLTLLILFVAVDLFLAVSAFYHLRQYTLPGWNAAKVVIPTYLILSLVFLGAAVYYLRQVQETALPIELLLPFDF